MAQHNWCIKNPFFGETHASRSQMPQEEDLVHQIPKIKKKKKTDYRPWPHMLSPLNNYYNVNWWIHHTLQDIHISSKLS